MRTVPPRTALSAGVFKPAGSDALADKLTAANNHRAGTPDRRRKTTDPERLRPGASVFISRLNFPEAAGGVVFMLRWRFLKRRSWLFALFGIWLLPRRRTFFSSSVGARTAFAGRPGPFTWREAQD
jgi:hypothetical protein